MSKEEHSEEEHEKPEHSKKEHKKSDILTISKVAVWQGISTVLALLLVVSILTSGFAFGEASASGSETGLAVLAAERAQAAQPRGAAPSEPSPSGPPVDTEALMEALIEDDDIKGDPDAPVTIVEFSDFECPFCARFYTQTLGQIEEEYINTGKAKIVFRDYPLSFHQNAQKAAEAAECAGEQGKFWDMHDKLFEGGVSGGVSSFKQYAADIGLDTTQFDSCIDSGEMASEVRKDMSDGQSAGIRGTPGFIINGQLVSGAQPFSVFQQVIEAELAR